jgi:AcrR family transcriptional regulator
MVYKLEKRKRYDREDWIKAALEVLVDQSVDAIAVESLARALNVTKGSFYWHFKDRDALLSAIVEYWRETATENVMKFVNQASPDPAERIRLLSKIAIDISQTSPMARMEIAIRAWGRRDAKVRKALLEDDKRRLSYLHQLFMECGLSEAEADLRAAILFGFAVGDRNVVRNEQKRAHKDRLDKMFDALIDAPIAAAK